ncbi:hypothetical protein B0P06_002212 [Clostridium saccharoperbutylacetonicum]|uniref:Uncharacterized protein n=1 Tax=Clostridium saccharoperbutylacetonicum N1-4(HMT) TaxID=931276 RepID=M1MNI1_9CLOT|nr:hypothetical protein [Clostridium saccharoperbutylacetonicum]AGF59449.1 hypothetical protein Cspa_c57240 [Clostridium saccharoperbutylacetonicum N1-4(HMT)]NRT59758.1 hypothetical protein [Clostridium saccharoperbutylacetonicum]NSB23070.1 hypothetical protein [Clostridium saccharoperbutylacetonicum]NSB42441.1 hypothetical protein [Clostridium saccharoperbutylacetonicum]
MREKLIEQVDHLSIEETKTVFENVKKLLISNVKKVKEFNFNAIPDTTEPVVFTKEEYPELPFNEVCITNPKEFKERIQLYHERMVEEYFKGSFKTE